MDFFHALMYIFTFPKLKYLETSIFFFFFFSFSKVQNGKYLPQLLSNPLYFLSDSSYGKYLQVLKKKF